MLAELRLEIECEEIPQFHYSKASLLQGVLMQNIKAEYAGLLHEQGPKPYSQCVRYEGGQNIWYIRTLSKEAYNQILEPLLKDEFSEFYLEHNEAKVYIKKKQLVQVPMSQMISDFYGEDAKRLFTISFLTPTAFKKDGRYHFFPDIYNIYQSLMQKYDAVSRNESMMDMETLEQMTQFTQIVSYNLRSTSFSLEGIRIPAYMGNIVIRINGSQTMANFARLLLQFGNYSGVGIKTAIGMGMIRVAEGRRTNDRERDKAGDRRTAS